MSLPSVNLSVYLRGSRNYIQGSQILGRTAEWLANERVDPSLVLVAAKFSRITAQGVVATLASNDEQSSVRAATWIGEARYSAAGYSPTVHFHERVGHRAETIADTKTRLQDFIVEGRLMASTSYEVDGTHESFIGATIESVKRLHASLENNVTDIWFTGLTTAQLPASIPYSTSGQFVVRPLLERRVEERLLTLSRIETVASIPVKPFNIGFSCRLSR